MHNGIFEYDSPLGASANENGRQDEQEKIR